MRRRGSGAVGMNRSHVWDRGPGVCVLAVGSFVLRVVVRRPAGSAFAWMLLVAMLPFAGFALYLRVRRAPDRARGLRRAAFLPVSRRSRRPLDVRHRRPAAARAAAASACRPALRAAGLPVLSGSTLDLHAGARTILRAIIETSTPPTKVDMAFYIWNAGARPTRWRRRSKPRRRACSAACCSTRWAGVLKSAWPARLRQAGVTRSKWRWGRPARPRVPARRPAPARKIVVVDERVAYTGSMNLVDPRFFKRDAGGRRVGRRRWCALPARRWRRCARCSLSTGSCRPASRSCRPARAAFAARRAVGGGAGAGRALPARRGRAGEPAHPRRRRRRPAGA